jgi:hypothetical protein
MVGAHIPAPSAATGDRASHTTHQTRLGHPAITGAFMSTAETRILHLHIPKTAGTAIRQAFGQINTGLKVYPHYDERMYRDATPDDYDLFSGHYGFDTARRLGGNVISVFRNPFDRFVSVYYFWRQLYQEGVERTRKTELAMKFPLDEFVLITDDLILVEEFYNRMTWQVACGSSIAQRHEQRAAGKSEEDIFALANKNLQSFALIGLQDRMEDFGAGLKDRFGVSLKIKPINVTEKRAPLADIKMTTRRRIYDWIYMDVALYERAEALSFRP